MLRRHFLRNISFVSAGVVLPAQALFARFFRIRQPLVTGRLTSKGKPIVGVGITDGYDIVLTNVNGEYTLQPHSNAQFVYIILPPHYQFPHQQGIASFYRVIDGAANTQTIHFELEPLGMPDNRHSFVIWGDTQILDKADADQLNQLSAPKTKEVVAALGNQPVHGIALGDLVFDKFDLYPDYRAAVAQTGIPFFQVIGNHDMDLGARSDEQSQRTYCKEFGPTYYSFNRGKIHYVVLDDVFMNKTNRGYIGYLPENQLAWLEKDLALVPAGSTVVVSLHIPTRTYAAKRNGQREESPGGMVSNRDVLYKMLRPYKAHIMSAHTHVNENWIEGDLMEHNHGTVCGAWWSGPVCSDGCPPGVAVYQADGDNLSWYYVPTQGSRQQQMRLYAPGKSAEKPQHVVANVWNWDAAWKVEWWQDDKAMGAMEQFNGLDPLANDLYLGPQLPAKHKWVEPTLTDHLFAAQPAPGTRQVVVKVTDRFGMEYEEKISLI